MSMFEFMKLSKKLDTILDSDVITNGAVKSVQRGVITLSTSTRVLTKEITISSVNPDKCLVLINERQNELYIDSAAFLHGQSLASLTSTVLTLYCAPSGYVSTNVSWQVIEFY